MSVHIFIAEKWLDKTFVPHLSNNWYLVNFWFIDVFANINENMYLFNDLVDKNVKQMLTLVI